MAGNSKRDIVQLESTAGTGYKQTDTTATVTGNGYAEISSEGTAFVRVDGLSKEPVANRTEPDERMIGILLRRTIPRFPL